MGDQDGQSGGYAKRLLKHCRHHVQGCARVADGNGNERDLQLNESTKPSINFPEIVRFVVKPRNIAVREIENERERIAQRTEYHVQRVARKEQTGGDQQGRQALKRDLVGGATKLDQNRR